MFETVKTEGNKEYYYNADNKLVYRYADETLHYRTEELTTLVHAYLVRARNIHKYPTKEFIDSVIDFQRESEKKAVNYIRYRLLGECNYLDVFGPEIGSDIKAESLENRLSEIENKINELIKVVGDINFLLFTRK